LPGSALPDGAGLALVAPQAWAAPARGWGCALNNTPQSRKLLAHAHFGAAAGGTFDDVGYDGSGDARFDRLLGLLLADLSLRDGVRPGFGFYDHGGSPNAYALSETKLPGTSGTVLFGRAMLKKALVDTANGDMFVMGICAHEFGHIVQYSSGVRTRLTANQQTGKLLELHADFLAGHYIGLRNEKYSPSELVALGRSWQGIGRYRLYRSHPSRHARGTGSAPWNRASGLRATGRNSPCRRSAKWGRVILVSDRIDFVTPRLPPVWSALLAVLLLAAAPGAAQAQEHMCADGQRSYFGVCPDGKAVPYTPPPSAPAPREMTADEAEAPRACRPTRPPIMPRPCRCFSAPPIRATPRRYSGLASCTAMVRAWPRIWLKRSGSISSPAPWGK
jgi:hypothetical protein